MRPGVVTAVALAGAVVLAVVLAGTRIGDGPEAIVHGRDTCARCRMIIGRPGYAGELRDRHGALRKYDDVGCLLQAMLAEHGEIPGSWVEDNATGSLVPLIGATFVRVPAEQTPMGHGIVAFAGEEAARRFAAEHAGRIVALEALVRDPALTARASSHIDRGQP